MPFDLVTGRGNRRRERGRMGHHAGLAAERIVAADYERRGHPLLHSRWRGQGGEIDLVFGDGDAVIFVEVKAARDFDTAAGRVSRRQIDRIFAAGDEYVDALPRGAFTDRRYDLALVDGRGAVDIRENAFAWL